MVDSISIFFKQMIISNQYLFSVLLKLTSRYSETPGSLKYLENRSSGIDKGKKLLLGPRDEKERED